jgi:hypothetical protein
MSCSKLRPFRGKPCNCSEVTREETVPVCVSTRETWACTTTLSRALPTFSVKSMIRFAPTVRATAERTAVARFGLEARTS